MTSEKEPAGLSKEEFQEELASSYKEIAEKTEDVNDLSRPTGGVLQINTDEGPKNVAEYEQMTRLKYRKLKERYNEREGLIEGIAEYIEAKLEKSGATDKEAARAAILDTLLVKEDVSEAMEGFLNDYADSNRLLGGGVGPDRTKKIFLENTGDAIPKSNLGRLVTLIDNTVLAVTDPSATPARVEEAVALSSGDNHDDYPSLRDVMIDSLQKKLEAKFKELGEEDAEQLRHLKESIIDSLDDKRLDKLLGDMAKKNAYFGADAKDIKTAKRQLKDNDLILEDIVSKAVNDGNEREEGIKARGEERDLDLSPPDNSFLKTALFGMMLTASAIQGYNYLSQASSPRISASSPDGSKPLAIGSPPSDSSTAVSLANQGISPDLGTSAAPGPGAMVTDKHAADLRAIDAASDSSMALRPTNQESSIPLVMSPVPDFNSVVTDAHAADLRAVDGANVTDVSLANIDGPTHGTSPIPGPDTMVLSTQQQSPTVTETTMALINTDKPTFGMSPTPDFNSVVTDTHAADLRAVDGANVTDLSLANQGTSPNLGTSAVPRPGAMVTDTHAADLRATDVADIRAANALNSVSVDTITPISHATTLSSQSPTAATFNSISVDAASGSQPQRSTAPLASINVTDRAANPVSQVTPLDAIQVSSSAPTVQAPKASKKLRKPILSPNDTFTAHNQTTGLTTRSYDNQIQDLNGLRADLKRLQKDSPEFIKTQLKVTKAENFLRKGRETGGDYREHELAVLDEKAAKKGSEIKDKQLAAEHRIVLANSNLIKLHSSLDILADKMKSGTDKTKTLAAYKSATLNVLKEEERKAKGIEDYLKANPGNKVDVNISKQQDASAKLIEHLKKADALGEAGFAEFDETLRKLSKESDKEYKLGTSTLGDPFITSNKRWKEEKTTTPTPQEPSPYETWLCKEAEKKYELENKGKKFDELSEEEQHKYNKQYVYANSSKKIKDYDASLSAGKVQGYSDGTGKTFELTGGAKIKFTVGIPGGLLTPEVEGNLNAVVRVQRKREDGTLSEISDMIEFKDGKIVGFHLNTEEDPAGPTTSQLDVKAVEKLAKKLEKVPVAKSAAVAANTQATTVDATKTQPPAPTVAASTQPPATTIAAATQQQIDAPSPVPTTTTSQNVDRPSPISAPQLSSTGALPSTTIADRTEPPVPTVTSEHVNVIRAQQQADATSIPFDASVLFNTLQQNTTKAPQQTTTIVDGIGTRAAANTLANTLTGITDSRAGSAFKPDSSPTSLRKVGDGTPSLT